ncbi:hypothetical protein NMY22_g14015 [Coprinellus aureogranulatus]|nr:hypothetical protein NMY22_g14015 [Coprinellus aureogranulatus]
MPKIIPLSAAASRRAEAVDSSKQRWLIENSSEDETVELAHVFERHHSADSKMASMRAIEYMWNMREGTLNLDSRRNIFFAGKVLHELYQEGKWALCPDESVIDMFLCNPRGKYPGSPRLRTEFPKLPDGAYAYTFFPLTEMSLRLLRQTRGQPPTADDMQAHGPPYTTLPGLTSHIHPKFALLNFSRRLIKGQRDPYIRNLLGTNRIARKVAMLFPSWNRKTLPDSAATDPTFIAQPSAKTGRRVSTGHAQVLGALHDGDSSSSKDENSESRASGSAEEDDEESEGVSDNDSTAATPPHRIWYPPPPPMFPFLPELQMKRPTRRPTTSDADGEPRKKHRKASTDDVGWTQTSISQWARGCISSSLPEPPYSPSSGTNAS